MRPSFRWLTNIDNWSSCCVDTNLSHSPNPELHEQSYFQFEPLVPPQKPVRQKLRLLARTRLSESESLQTHFQQWNAELLRSRWKSRCLTRPENADWFDGVNKNLQMPAVQCCLQNYRRKTPRAGSCLRMRKAWRSERVNEENVADSTSYQLKRFPTIQFCTSREFEEMSWHLDFGKCAAYDSHLKLERWHLYSGRRQSPVFRPYIHTLQFPIVGDKLLQVVVQIHVLEHKFWPSLHHRLLACPACNDFLQSATQLSELTVVGVESFLRTPTRYNWSHSSELEAG